MAAVTLVDISPVGGGDGSVQSSSSTTQTSPIQFNILSLPDPANDNDGASPPMREYNMLVSRNNKKLPAAASMTSSNNNINYPYDIYEIQTVLPHSGKYASHFVGSRIISNPALHLSTRVDPLFFALAHFQRIMTKDSSAAEQLSKWQPWEQTLGDMPLPILRALNLDTKLNIGNINEVGQLGHLIDVSDMCGDDLILAKFNDEKALKWLVAKYDKALEALRKRLHNKKRMAAERSKELRNMSGGSGAFSSSFNVGDDDDDEPKDISEEKESNNEDELSKDEENSLKIGALQLICEYIPTEWKNKLSKEVGMSQEEWMGKKKGKSSSATNDNGDESNNTSGEKRSRSSWEGSIGQADADALYQYSQGGGGNSASVITPGDKKDVKNAQSVGLKRLAKVNKKGMKSLTSFFGASTKKKKT